MVSQPCKGQKTNGEISNIYINQTMKKKIILTLVSLILLAFIVLYFTSRPTETEDGSYIPSPLALKLAIPPTTDFVNTVYENKYTGNKKVLMVCTEQKNMTMANGKKFSTGNHPVEILLPVLHLKNAGFDVEVVTPNGKPVVIEQWAMPKDDEYVKAIYTEFKKKFENPGNLSEFVTNTMNESSDYVAIFIPGGHGAMLGLPIVVSLILKFFTKGILSMAAILIGLLAGYTLAFALGMVNFAAVGKASWITSIQPLPYGFEFNLGAVIAVTLVSIVSAIETVGDASATTKAGAGREATDEEIAGATYADGLGTAVAGVFGGLPNTSFSQNVGIIGMTGVMSRHVVTIAGVIMIVCGLVPKIGALIASMPLPVLGGGVIVMFGMVAAAGLNVLAEEKMTRRTMIIIAVSLAFGLGLNLVPTAVQYLPGVVKTLATSAVAPTALMAIVLNLVLPQEMDEA